MKKNQELVSGEISKYLHKCNIIRPKRQQAKINLILIVLELVYNKKKDIKREG